MQHKAAWKQIADRYFRISLSVSEQVEKATIKTLLGKCNTWYASTFAFHNKIQHPILKSNLVFLHGIIELANSSEYLLNFPQS